MSKWELILQMKNYIRLMRVHHYIKNILVLTPLLFSGQLFDQKKMMDSMMGFVCFCLLSSIIYIINDINDREHDKNHPVKCKRPIASGAIAVPNAIIVVGTLFVIIVCVCMYMRSSCQSMIWLALYLLLNIGYSKGWKNKPVVDVSILAFGFLIRVLYGASVIQVEVSPWLYMTVLTLAYFFGFGKRRNELIRQKSDNTRIVLRYYSKDFLDKNMYMFLCLGIMFYSLWSVEIATRSGNKIVSVIWTVPMVILIFMKYCIDIDGESDGDPVEVLLHDKSLLLLCSIYGIILLWILYF